MIHIENQRWIRYFLAVEGLLYVSFLLGDLLDLPTDIIKFTAIALCAGLACARIRRTREWFVPGALVLSLIADAFLLFHGPYLIGVLCFYGVQSLYGLRLMWLRGRVRQFRWRDHVPSGVWRNAVYGAALVALRVAANISETNLMTPLHAAALKSFSQLSVNAVEAWQLQRFEPRARSFAVGLGLFWICDLCVGLRYLLAGAAGAEFAGLGAPIAYAIWTLYLPAQVCLTLTGEITIADRRKAGCIITFETNQGDSK